MIGYLRGTLKLKRAPALLIDVSGVGYDVLVPMTTAYHLPSAGETIELWIHTLVREDALQLYGFNDQNDRSLFQSLIKVNGVGAKLALTILSGMNGQQFLRCVQQQNIDLLTSVPGIGKKTAQRLLMETQHLIGKQEWLADAVNANVPDASADAIQALISLGYKEKDAKTAILQLSKAKDHTSEELIRLGLQHMLKGGSRG